MENLKLKVGDPVWVFRPSCGDALVGNISTVFDVGYMVQTLDNPYESSRPQTRVFRRPEDRDRLISEMQSLADRLIESIHDLRDEVDTIIEDTVDAWQASDPAALPDFVGAIIRASETMSDAEIAKLATRLERTNMGGDRA